MALWVIKGGRQGEMEQAMLQHSILWIGWRNMPDLAPLKDRSEFEKTYRVAYPEAPDPRVSNHVGQLLAFAKTMQKGDLVALPLKTRTAIAIAEVTGEYVHRSDLGPDIKHTRPGRWLRTDLPRTHFDKDLLYSFGALMTFCKVKRDKAEERIRKMLNGHPAAPVGPLSSPAQVEPTESEADIEQQAHDQIADYIARKFRGHDLARIVDALLRAQGFITKLSPPGPDGGVDILAGGGAMGFDSPRICAQVKSSDAPADVTVYRNLKGTMDHFQADQGLLVAWGGFKETLHKEAANSFFKVRLWDAGNLIDALLANYGRLDADIQAELPLKRVWTLALPEEDE